MAEDGTCPGWQAAATLRPTSASTCQPQHLYRGLGVGLAVGGLLLLLLAVTVVLSVIRRLPTTTRGTRCGDHYRPHP